MTDKAQENIKTGDKAEQQEHLSPAKAGENQITKKADFSKAFQTAHAHDRTLSGTHDAAFEIVDGSSTLVSSQKQEQKPDSRSEAYLKSVKNPTADALYEMRKNIDQLPPGPQKEKALTEARKTQKEMFPACYEHIPDDNDGGIFKALTPDSPQPFTVGERSDGGMLIKTGVETKHIAEPPPPNFMAAMTPEMRAGIIKAFQGAPAVADQSLSATTDDVLKQTSEGYIDVVKFPVDVTVAACKGLWGILEFERDLMIDPERAQETAATAGDYIGKALVAGVKLWAGGSEYANQVKESGDYRRPFQDLGNAINKWYDDLTPGDQMHVMASISGGFGLGAAAGQLRQLAKPGAFVEFMEEAAHAVPKNPEAQEKAAQTIRDIIQSFSKPKLKPVLETGIAEPGGSELGSQIDRASKALKDKFEELHHKMTAHKPEGGKGKWEAGREAREVDIPAARSLDNIQTRDWYNDRVAEIDDFEQQMKDAGKSSKEIFDQVFELRNKAKQQARDLMKDRVKAEELDRDFPLPTREEVLGRYGNDYDKAIAASKRTNADINQQIEQLRKRKD